VKKTVTVLGTREGRWPDKDSGPWILRLAFGIVGDRPGVVGVELYAVDPAKIKKAALGWPQLGKQPVGAEAITTAGARIPLAEKLTEYLASTEYSDRIISQAPSFPEKLRKAARDRLRLLEDPVAWHGPGRPAQYGREHWEQVAQIYTEALRAGESPTTAVQIKAVVSQATARKWVARARELGLLPRTTQGKAAAWPTPRQQGRQQSRGGTDASKS
jgi:hypothetical protein